MPYMLYVLYFICERNSDKTRGPMGLIARLRKLLHKKAMIVQVGWSISFRLEKEHGLPFEQSPSPNDALCQVW